MAQPVRRNLSGIREAVTLDAALRDPEVRLALKEFVIRQSMEYTRLCVNEVRKSQPDTLKAAQHAGRMDAYENLLSELDYFVANELAKL